MDFDKRQDVKGGRTFQGHDEECENLTPGMSRSCSFWAFSQFQMAMPCELPPAAARVRASAVGWILICHVSEGGVSMTALVLPSARFHTLMKLSRELEAAYVPLLSDVTDMTPRVCPAIQKEGCLQIALESDLSCVFKQFWACC